MLLFIGSDFMHLDKIHDHKTADVRHNFCFQLSEMKFISDPLAAGSVNCVCRGAGLLLLESVASQLSNVVCIIRMKLHAG